ncbi:MAG: cobalamin B12-binding domain-containing protein [Nitrospinae bacterium]|nr:cobalamin B12-binding domain-containing protein [Nitrospinota bacterium]
MRQLKVLMVHPPDPEGHPNPFQWRCEPLGLEYVAAACKQDDHIPRILDLRLWPDRLESAIIEFEPDVVGTTGYSMHVYRAREVCDTVKRLRPGCLTAVGGHHATVAPEDFMHPSVDMIFRGEGVRQFAGTLKRLAMGDSDPASGAEGAIRKGMDGLFTPVNGHKLPSRAPDLLPLPARDMNPADRGCYRMGAFESVALMATSVGCAFRCNFCALWKLMDGAYMARDIDSVVEELGGIQEEYVFFTDDEPFTDRKRMERLADAVIAAGIKKKIMSYCRADTMTRHPELVAKWRDAGLVGVSMGVEAVTEKELDGFNKRIKPSQVEEAFMVARRIGVEIFPLFIVGTDYQPKDFKRLARYIQRHNIENPIFSVLTPLPGSDLLTDFSAITETVSGGRPNWELFDLQHPVTATAMPKEAFMRAYYELWGSTRVVARKG